MASTPANNANFRRVSKACSFLFISRSMEDDDSLLLNISQPTGETSSSSGRQKRPAPDAGKASAKRSKKQRLKDKDRENNKKTTVGKVSSIFSSNPDYKPPTLPQQPPVKPRDAIPSNAPLADATTFTGLGIESDLVELLMTKFDIHAPTRVQQRAIPILLGPSRTVRGVDIPNNDVDVVVQAETGSGKTLTYLLPIVNRLVAASTTTEGSSYKAFGERAIGTVAIILTPTHELAQQVTGVLSQLLNLPKPKSRDIRRVHWIVPGMIAGGENKNKEKARLRKGINILVSTPGRLLDHLENTKSFNVRNLKWLVLDEADRLLDLGFEEQLKKIMTIIKERTTRGCSPEYREAMSHKFWPSRRQTVLCSATLRDDVRDLAGAALVRPTFVSGNVNEQEEADVQKALESHIEKDNDVDIKFTTPNQLRQTYVLAPAKLRLVTLVTMIKSCFMDVKRNRPKPSKVIVFMSCCDSVDFHFKLFVNVDKPEEDEEKEEEEELEEEVEGQAKDAEEPDEVDVMNKALSKILGSDAVKINGAKNNTTKPAQKVKKEKTEDKARGTSSLLNDVPVFRLHGDLEQKTRTLIYNEFSKTRSGVLLCTDVAARGLDLPNVDQIIQYDPPTDLKDYVHRVGRTARLGKAGTAALFLLPSEIEYLDVLKAQDLVPEPVTVESILSHLGKLSSKGDFQTPAQELQNKMERYVLAKEEVINENAMNRMGN